MVKDIRNHNMTVLFPSMSGCSIGPLVKSAYKKTLFLSQNICCGFSKEPSQCDSSFEHHKHMLKLMCKKSFTILRSKMIYRHDI